MRFSVSLVCAGLSYGLLLGYGVASSVVLPPILELLHTSPHLAMLGLLAFALSPAFVITTAHRMGSGMLDALDGKITKSGGGAAAGAHGWLVLYGTTVLTSLVLLVVFPPELEPESFSVMGVASRLFISHVVSLHSLIWVSIAAVFFHLQRRAQI